MAITIKMCFFCRFSNFSGEVHLLKQAKNYIQRSNVRGRGKIC